MSVSDGEWEDGEVLEEGEEREEAPPPPPAASAAAPASDGASLGSVAPVKAEKPAGEGAARLASQPWPPLPPHRAPPPHGGYAGRNGHSYHRQAPAQPYRPPASAGGQPFEQDDRAYSAELVLKYPRQQPRSRVLLDFASWMEAARSRRRLTVDDVQSLLLKLLEASGEEDEDEDDRVVSEFLLPSLCPGTPLPRRVCVVLLGGVHPAVVQKFRATLPFFDACSSVPVSLTKREHARRIESPLAELLYKFPKPHVDSRYGALPPPLSRVGQGLTHSLSHTGSCPSRNSSTRTS